MRTGDEYRRSIEDERLVYYRGERVSDQAAHPAFQDPIARIAEGYDRFYREGAESRNPLFCMPTSNDELREIVQTGADVDMALFVTCQMHLALRVVASRIEGKHPHLAQRIDAYVDRIARQDLRLAECITDSKGSRTKRPGEQQDLDAYVHVVHEDSEGITIRGAKHHITAASLVDDLVILPTKAMRPDETPWAVACRVPVDASGVRIVNTTPFAPADNRADHPYSSQNSFPDGLVMFEDVRVPHEDVFLNGETESAALFAHSLGLWERLASIARMVDEADTLVGLALLIAEANGTSKVAHVQEKIDLMMIHATTLRAGLEAAIARSDRTSTGFVVPSELFTNAAKHVGSSQYHDMVRNLQDIAGGSTMTVPSSDDFDNPELASLLDKYLTGAVAEGGRTRARLFHAIADQTAGRYGGWRQVTTLLSGGGLFAQRLVTRKHYDNERAIDLARRAAGLSD